MVKLMRCYPSRVVTRSEMMPAASSGMKKFKYPFVVSVGALSRASVARVEKYGMCVIRIVQPKCGYVLPPVVTEKVVRYAAVRCLFCIGTDSEKNVK